MLDLTTHRSIIEEYLEDNFSLCTIRYENAKIPVDESQEWISIHDKQSLSESVAMGEDFVKSDGNLIIGIYVPRGTGTVRARLIAKTISDLFNQEVIQGINFQEPVFYGSPGSDPNIAWYQMNLVLPYTAVYGQDYTADC